MTTIRHIDFHTHILPRLDDGSSCCDESLAMLLEEKNQGIGAVCLTPHFYPSQTDPETFLKRREDSYKNLRKAMEEDMSKADGSEIDKIFPGLILGAEVHYFDGIGRNEDISTLHLGDSKLLLLEMPMCRWTRRMIDDVIELNRREDTRVILAHIERYLNYQSGDLMEILCERKIIMQANASFLLNFKTGRRAVSLLKREHIHILGSDCHNMKDRIPHLGYAIDKLRKKNSSLEDRLLEREQELMEMIKR